MSLLFGNLTQDFVNFQMVINQASAGNATAVQEIPIVAERFRRTSAKDATYLVYMGQTLLLDFVVFHPDMSYRCWIVRLYLHLHVSMGIHRRSQREAHPRTLPQGSLASRHSIL